MERLSYEERLRELWLSSMDERSSYQCTYVLEGRVQRRWSQVLSVVSSDITRGNGKKIKYQRYQTILFFVLF